MYCPFLYNFYYNQNKVINSLGFSLIIMSPNRRGGGHTALGADPVGVRVTHCLHSIS